MMGLTTQKLQKNEISTRNIIKDLTCIKQKDYQYQVMIIMHILGHTPSHFYCTAIGCFCKEVRFKGLEDYWDQVRPRMF